MPRRAEIQPRPVVPDPVYDSQLVTQLQNRVMLDGKKSVAEQIVYSALEKVGERTGRPPVEVRPRRATTLAIRWLTTFSSQRREKTMAERLAGEILDASNNIGASVKRREDMHKMAESNKAFAHYRW